MSSASFVIALSQSRTYQISLPDNLLNIGGGRDVTCHVSTGFNGFVNKWHIYMIRIWTARGLTSLREHNLIRRIKLDTPYESLLAQRNPAKICLT